MKTLILLAVLVTSLFINSNVIAQPGVMPPCKPDCDEINYQPTSTTVLTLPNGCVVRVWYTWRLSCFGMIDVAIQKVEMLTPNCANSVSNLLDDVFIALLTQNPMGLAMPGIGMCFDRYRAIRGGCWRTDTVDCDGDTIAIPCDSIGCCVTRFRICRGLTGTLTITELFSTGGTDSCDAYPWSCHPVCPSSEPRVRPLGLDDDESSNGKSQQLIVIPNPALNSVRIATTGLSKGEWTVTVVNELGAVVSSFKTQVDNPNERDIVLNDLPATSGTYYVRVETPTTTLNTTFTILR